MESVNPSETSIMSCDGRFGTKASILDKMGLDEVSLNQKDAA